LTIQVSKAQYLLTCNNINDIHLYIVKESTKIKLRLTCHHHSSSTTSLSSQ